jgi:hypothetical protein
VMDPLTIADLDGRFWDASDGSNLARSRNRPFNCSRRCLSTRLCERPSKSAIVNGSITHLTSQRNARLIAAKELRALFSENQEILQELNEYRVQTGKVVKVSIGWTAGMEEVVKVEDETFGTFTSFDEDGLDGDDVAEQEDLVHSSLVSCKHGGRKRAVAGLTRSSLSGRQIVCRSDALIIPAYANPESSLASTSPSSQEAISNRQQALLMMQQSGHPLFARRAHISPTAGRGSFAHADRSRTSPCRYKAYPLSPAQTSRCL